MNKIIIKKGRFFKGEMRAFSSKSYMHRALIASVLSEGIITNISLNNDVLTTIDIIKQIGGYVDIYEEKIVIKRSKDILVNKNYVEKFYFNESGSSLRFFIPILTNIYDGVILDGDISLKKRPLNVYKNLFDINNMYYEKLSDYELPLKVSGKFTAGKYEIKLNESSQYISGLLFLLPLLDDDSIIIYSKDISSRNYIDMTLDIIRKHHIEVKKEESNENIKLTILKNQKYMPYNHEIEGDFSQAAFFISLAVLNGDIKIRGLNINSIQGDKMIVEIIKKMGGDIEFIDDELIIKKSDLRAINISANNILDIIPILSCVMSVSEGKSEIRDINNLRYKESNRIEAIVSNLKNIGADIKVDNNRIIIEGKKELEGGFVNSYNDHRIAMAFSVIACKCKNDIIIDNKDVVNKSYPSFFDDYTKLGGICKY